MNIPKEKYLNTPQASLYLCERGISNMNRAKLSRLRYTGKGPRYYKQYRTIYYLASDLEQWLSETMQQVPAKESVAPQKSVSPKIYN